MTATTERLRVAGWIERLADAIERLPGARHAQPLVVAYATAAKRAGFDSDLLARMWGAASEEEPYDPAMAANLRAIAVEAKRRYGPP